jgi:cystathionine beta-synthase
VRVAMTQKIETVNRDTPVGVLMETFDKGHVAIVMDGEKLYGLITRVDVLNHLRRLASA